MRCWGDGEEGQLGDGVLTDSTTPLAVGDAMGELEGAVAISSGLTNGCVADAYGGAHCWGLNYVGQLGTGDTVDHSAPVDVVSLP